MSRTDEDISLGCGIPMSFSSIKVRQFGAKKSDTIPLSTQEEVVEKEKPWT